jgi:alpha/beta superfamily hydrolase
MRIIQLVFACGLLFATSLAAANPFEVLRKAYATRDASLAATAYAPDAEVTYRYAGAPVERHVGRVAIAASFRALFDQIDPADTLDLNFRTVEIGSRSMSGFYRLRLGRSGDSFGRFTVTLAPGGLFATDLGSDATQQQFEDAAGALMFAAEDETLARSYYGQLAGRYRLPDGCDLIVTRSVVRLFVRNGCTDSWRGLTRKSGREWTGGDRVLSDKVIATYRFGAPDEVVDPGLVVEEGGVTRFATRVTAYRTEDVTFTAADGVTLAGTLYLPDGVGPHPASVMLHGSGPQDRDGYASIIAVLADELAASGRIVLAYDKRGSGGSGGDGGRAGFAILADDAHAAMKLLAARPDVDVARIGLAGSSQAGWIAAKAVERGATPADVLLLGAAGAAVSVARQNLYNSDVLMRCTGLAERDIQLALDQQRAFFAFLRDPRAARRLDALTVRAAARPALADWLFPDSRRTERTADAWYVVLDPDFDPLPIWRDYPGQTLFMFAEHDDATPSAAAVRRLEQIGRSAIVFPGAQHLGLLASGPCDAGMNDVSTFAPGLFRAITEFAAAR